MVLVAKDTVRASCTSEKFVLPNAQRGSQGENWEGEGGIGARYVWFNSK